MFKGKVLRGFVDKVTKAHYPVGSTYITDSEDRMAEIVATGEAKGVVYVDFEAPDVETPKTLSAMTVPELRAFAESIGVELKAAKKADIIAELEAIEVD